MLSLISGQYPATADQMAVTGGVAADFHLSIGSSWTVGGVTRKVTGIVANPQNLLDEFALVMPGQVTAPDPGHGAVRRAGRHAASRLGPTVATPRRRWRTTNVINPETISLAAAVLGMLLIAMVGAGGFTVLAQRRLRAIGMLAAQGATESNIRLVVRANGVATGVVGAVAGFVLGLLAWLAYRPHVQTSAHHVIGVFQLPWTVIGISMVLAVIATYVAASRPAKAIARVPIVAALAGRPPAPKKTRHLAVPIGSASWSSRSSCSARPGPAAAAAAGARPHAGSSSSASSRSPSPSCCWPRPAGAWSPPPASGARSRYGSRCGTWPGTGPGPARRWRRSASAR